MAMMRKMRRLSLTALMALLLLSGLARIVSAGLSSTPEDQPDNGGIATLEGALFCPPSDEVATLIREVEQRDTALAQRETAVALREQDILIARQEVEGALIQLTQAEDRLAARMSQSGSAADTDIDRLVDVYEGMKPKEAAVLFEAMEPGFAAGFLARMSADSASALFTNLSPEKAYALSVLMAGRNANAARE